jgi:hypothetical protein
MSLRPAQDRVAEINGSIPESRCHRFRHSKAIQGHRISGKPRQLATIYSAGLGDPCKLLVLAITMAPLRRHLSGGDDDYGTSPEGTSPRRVRPRTGAYRPLISPEQRRLLPLPGLFTLIEPRPGNLGFSLAGAAATNGDGFDDLLLGAQYYDTYLCPETATRMRRTTARTRRA